MRASSGAEPWAVWEVCAITVSKVFAHVAPNTVMLPIETCFIAIDALESLNEWMKKLCSCHLQSARSIQSPFWPAGGSPARDRRTAVLFPIEWNRRNKSADLEKESTAHYKVMQKLVKSAVFLYIFCEKKCSFLHISYIRQILAILRNRNTNIL